MRAYELKQQGWKQRDIAAVFGVTEAAVSQWMTTAGTIGVSALQARPRPGAPRRLTDEQLWMIPDCLSHGAEAYGFRGDVWTCARAGKVIEWEFGVTYDRSQVSRLLKQIGWTPQQPIERASQRDDVQIEQWRTQVWSELKKGAFGAPRACFCG